MAEILGPATIASLALPTGADGGRVAQWQLRDGANFGAVVNELALALGDLNQDLVTRYGDLFSITEEALLEYEQGGAVTELQEITDVDKPDSISGSTLAHMIDLRVYGGAIGGTKRFFRDARRAQLAAQVATLVRKAQWRFEKKLLTRFFSNTENAIGSGYDVPFVRGTGGNVDYVPPPYAGQSFSASHDHFLGVDSDNQDHGDALEALVATLVEHGHSAPFTALVSQADYASGVYHALSNFVKLQAPVIHVTDRGGATTGNQFFALGMPQAQGVAGFYDSRYGQVTLKPSARIPANYLGVFKSYGELDARNPLAVRVHPDSGFGVRLVVETTNDLHYPLKQVNIEFEFGVSVGADRSNGAVAYINSSGTWTNPSIG